jgi:hypothetical protein
MKTILSIIRSARHLLGHLKIKTGKNTAGSLPIEDYEYYLT